MKVLKKEELYVILAFKLQGNLIGFTSNPGLWGVLVFFLLLQSH